MVVNVSNTNVIFPWWHNMYQGNIPSSGIMGIGMVNTRNVNTSQGNHPFMLGIPKSNMNPFVQTQFDQNQNFG